MKLSALFLLLALVTLTLLRAWSEEQDILESLKGHELGMMLAPNGRPSIPVKYGDPVLARAEQNLSDIPRPWTVPKMIAIFKRERGELERKIAALPPGNGSRTPLELQWYDRCKYLVRVLAASRDPRAAVALGEAFEKSSEEQADEMEAMFYYFVKDYYYGLPADAKERKWETGNLLELTMPATKRWWNDNKTRLRKKAAALEIHR